jgi:hypothetical protein
MLIGRKEICGYVGWFEAVWPSTVTLSNCPRRPGTYYTVFLIINVAGKIV